MWKCQFIIIYNIRRNAHWCTQCTARCVRIQNNDCFQRSTAFVLSHSLSLSRMYYVLIMYYYVLLWSFVAFVTRRPIVVVLLCSVCCYCCCDNREESLSLRCDCKKHPKQQTHRRSAPKTIRGIWCGGNQTFRHCHMTQTDTAYGHITI